MLRVFAEHGQYDMVYELLVNEGEHGWVNMLREGATNCFEAWGKDQKWNTSLCHPWASAPIPIFFSTMIFFPFTGTQRRNSLIFFGMCGVQ